MIKKKKKIESKAAGRRNFQLFFSTLPTLLELLSSFSSPHRIMNLAVKAHLKCLENCVIR